MKSLRILHLIASLLLAFSIACNSAVSTPTPAPVPTPTEVARVAPTPAPTATTAPTVVAEKPARRGGTVNVNVLFTSAGRDGKVEGGLKVLKVTVAPKAEHGISVVFPQSEVGSQGDSIQAAGWTSAVMSSLLLGVDPGKLSFTYDIRGRVDGPSAGALMTIGTLAAILGDEVSKDVAMTGTINTDGSIGPVGGIAHKIDGAAKDGIKVVLVPVGQRTDVDLNQKRVVDLVRRGEEQGVTVKMVSNIYEAYQHATGKPLPQPKAAGAPTMPSSVSDKMRAQAQAWLARHSENRDRYNSLSPEVKRIWETQMKKGDEYAGLANRSLREGNYSVGLERAITAVQYSLPLNRAGQLYQTVLDRGLPAAVSQVKASSQARNSMGALFERLRAEQPKTASDSLGLMDAYSNAIVAETHIAKGDLEVDNLVKNSARMKEDDILDALFAISDQYSSAEIFIEITKTNLDVYMGQGTSPAPGTDMLVGLAEMLRRAGEANLNAFESIVVSDIARDLNLRDEVVRSRLARLDSHYEIALYTSRQLGIDSSRSGLTKMQQVYYTLGGAQNVYALSAQLISKYYSLGAELDKDFRVTGFRRETALQSMLQLAERRSDDLLGLSKDVPISSVYYAENARVYRDGNAQNKLTALFYYWQSSLLSNVLANMTGEFGEKIQGDLKATNRSAEFHRANSFRP